MEAGTRDNLLVAMALLERQGFGQTALRRALLAAQAQRKPLAQWIHAPASELARAADAGTVAQVVAAMPLRLDRVERMLTTIAALGGTAHLLTDEAYPASLRDLAEPPPLVFHTGEDALLEKPAGAVVGARKAGAEGLRLASESAAVLAAEGPVVSGGADGVDLAAHEAAAGTPNGGTIIVLPQGIFTYTPPSFLADAIDEGRVLAISAELPLDPWETHQAVGRNAMIAALSRVVVVIEPDKTGGSIRTAEAALDIGRRVFVWGSGPRVATIERLIARGAYPLADDTGAVRVNALVEGVHAEPSPKDDQPYLF